MSEHKRSGWRTGIMALIACAMLYLLGYPPILKWHPFGRWSAHVPYYGPAEWLIDNTPLYEPLKWWAGVCGAEDDYQSAATWRMIDRAEGPGTPIP